MTKKKSKSSVTMMKIPSFLDCFLKISDYLGLAYSEKDESTCKARIKELNDFDEQGGYFTNFYYEELIGLLAINDPEIETFIRSWLEISESTTRLLIAQDYYTLASNKRVLWALLVYFYIPNFACFIIEYKKKFSIPICLIRNDFMLPHNNSGMVVYPTERLKKILSEIDKFIREKHIEKTAHINTLTQYLHNFSKLSIPLYKTKQSILNEIKQTKELDSKLSQINLLFQFAIISGGIFKDLISYFGQESAAMDLINYFKKCLVSIEDVEKKDDFTKNVFDRFLSIHLALYNKEFLLNKYQKDTKSDSDMATSDIIRTIQEQRDNLRNSLVLVFNVFLRTTIPSNFDALEEIETEKCNIGMFRCRLPVKNEALDVDHEKIIHLLSQLDVIFASQEEALNETEINRLFSEINSHKFYSKYEHLHMYYIGLSQLGRNDFSAAINSLCSALEMCSNVTAGKTQLEVAYTLIILKLLTNKRTSYSQLNNELKSIMSIVPIRTVAYVRTDILEAIHEKIFNKTQKESKKINTYEIETQWPKLLSKEANLARILTRIKRFNNVGYCRYPGVEPCIYNPLAKVESLVSDIYSFLDDLKQLPSSKDEAIKQIVHELMRTGKAKYKISKNLVTLHSFTAKDIFDKTTFGSIAGFCATANINCPNILRLANDLETFSLISQAINTPMRSRS